MCVRHTRRYFQKSVYACMVEIQGKWGWHLLRVERSGRSCALCGESIAHDGPVSRSQSKHVQPEMQNKDIPASEGVFAFRATEGFLAAIFMLINRCSSLRLRDLDIRIRPWRCRCSSLAKARSH